MKTCTPVFFGLVLGVCLSFAPFVHAGSSRFYRVPSPDHEQTFSYGSESNRVWAQWGSDHHLALLLNFTNDPFVDRQNPRQYDNFVFSFPDVKLGRDGHTFYYHAPDGRTIPVAGKRPDFLGINEIKLLPNAEVIIEKPHGYLSLTLEIQDPG
jgi:hypothetical protein